MSKPAIEAVDVGYGVAGYLEAALAAIGSYLAGSVQWSLIVVACES